ncbi:hypothetical protein K7432_004745 [Basidiobolus ranarum]|uniref:Uncharacterized protein n=1 Tax=Basidiobolus ranarum TaxID=34480 RepID=A0ABR2WXV8_9FUNG
MRLINKLVVATLVAGLTGTNGQIFRPITKVQGTDGRSNLPANDFFRDFLPGPIADLVSAPIIGAASVAANVLKTAGCVIGFCGLRSGGTKPAPPPKRKNNNNGNGGRRIVYMNGNGQGNQWQGNQWQGNNWQGNEWQGNTW